MDCIELRRRQALPPDRAELTRCTEHVAYEIAAMEASAALYRQSPVWLALDGFLLHARQLREFLWGRWESTGQFAESALFAEHYSQTWRSVRGGYPQAVDRTKLAIDKQLAHITRERDRSGTIDLGNEVASLRGELIHAWKRFINHLGTDEMAQHFQHAVAKKCSELGVPVP